MSNPEEETISHKAAVFIKEKRLALGMSQREFSKHVFGTVKHQEWICRIENGRGITLETFGKILKGLKAEINIVEN